MTHIVPKKLLLLVGSAAMLALSTSAQAQVQTRLCMEHWLPLSNAYAVRNEIDEMLRGSGVILERIEERSKNTELEIQTVRQALQAVPNDPNLQARLDALQARSQSYAKARQNDIEMVARRNAAERSIERLDLQYYDCMARAGFTNLPFKDSEGQTSSPDEVLAAARRPPTPPPAAPSIQPPAAPPASTASGAAPSERPADSQPPAPAPAAASSPPATGPMYDCALLRRDLTRRRGWLREAEERLDGDERFVAGLRARAARALADAERNANRTEPGITKTYWDRHKAAAQEAQDSLALITSTRAEVARQQSMLATQQAILKSFDCTEEAAAPGNTVTATAPLSGPGQSRPPGPRPPREEITDNEPAETVPLDPSTFVTPNMPPPPPPSYAPDPDAAPARRPAEVTGVRQPDGGLRCFYRDGTSRWNFTTYDPDIRQCPVIMGNSPIDPRAPAPGASGAGPVAALPPSGARPGAGTQSAPPPRTTQTGAAPPSTTNVPGAPPPSRGVCAAGEVAIDCRSGDRRSSVCRASADVDFSVDHYKGRGFTCTVDRTPPRTTEPSRPETGTSASASCPAVVRPPRYSIEELFCYGDSRGCLHCPHQAADSTPPKGRRPADPKRPDLTQPIPTLPPRHAGVTGLMQRSPTPQDLTHKECTPAYDRWSEFSEVARELDIHVTNLRNTLWRLNKGIEGQKIAIAVGGEQDAKAYLTKLEKDLEATNKSFAEASNNYSEISARAKRLGEEWEACVIKAEGRSPLASTASAPTTEAESPAGPTTSTTTTAQAAPPAEGLLNPDRTTSGHPQLTPLTPEEAKKEIAAVDKLDTSDPSLWTNLPPRVAPPRTPAAAPASAPRVTTVRQPDGGLRCFYRDGTSSWNFTTYDPTIKECPVISQGIGPVAEQTVPPPDGPPPASGGPGLGPVIALLPPLIDAMRPTAPPPGAKASPPQGAKTPPRAPQAAAPPPRAPAGGAPPSPPPAGTSTPPGANTPVPGVPGAAEPPDELLPPEGSPPSAARTCPQVELPREDLRVEYGCYVDAKGCLVCPNKPPANLPLPVTRKKGDPRPPDPKKPDDTLLPIPTLPPRHAAATPSTMALPLHAAAPHVAPHAPALLPPPLLPPPTLPTPIANHPKLHPPIAVHPSPPPAHASAPAAKPKVVRKPPPRQATRPRYAPAPRHHAPAPRYVQQDNSAAEAAAATAAVIGIIGAIAGSSMGGGGWGHGGRHRGGHAAPMGRRH